MIPPGTHDEVIAVSNFEEIPIDSIIRAYRRQETSLLHRRITPPITQKNEITPNRPKVLLDDNLSNFTTFQDENLLNVARENNLDELVKNIGDEVILTARIRSRSVRRYSTIYKVCEGILRTLIVIAGIASAVLSINGLNSSTETNDTIVFVVGVIITIIPVLSEFKDRMNFKTRSTKLREYYNKYQEKIRLVRQIMVSDLTPFEALDKIYQIETKLNELDLASFDQHFSKEPTTENFVSCTSKHKCTVHSSEHSSEHSSAHTDEIIDPNTDVPSGPSDGARIIKSSDGIVEARLVVEGDSDSSDSE